MKFEIAFNLTWKIPFKMKFGTIFEKIILPVWFWKMSGKSPTFRKYKTQNNFFWIYHQAKYIHKVYTYSIYNIIPQRRVPLNSLSGSHCLGTLLLVLSPKGEFLRTLRGVPLVRVLSLPCFFILKILTPPTTYPKSTCLLCGWVVGWVVGWLGGRIYLFALWAMIEQFFQVFSVVGCLA